MRTAEATQRTSVIREKKLDMIYYTCMLLVVGVIATILGLDGVGAAALQIAAILFVLEMVVVMVIHLATGRTVEAP